MNYFERTLSESDFLLNFLFFCVFVIHWSGCNVDLMYFEVLLIILFLNDDDKNKIRLDVILAVYIKELLICLQL